MLGRYDRAMRARQPVGRLTLLQQAIAAIRRNNGTLFYVPQNALGDGAPNLLSAPEFAGGLTDAPTRDGLITASTMTGYDGAIAFGHDGSASSYAYKTFTPTVGLTYTISVIVKMDDGLAPTFGNAARAHVSNTFALVANGGAIAPTTYTVSLQSDGSYRVSGAITATSGALNTGVAKYATNNNRTFKVTGYKLELGSTATAYTPQSVLRTRGVFIDSAGVSPVTNIADVIGRMTDRAGGSAVATQTATANKPTVQRPAANNVIRFDASNDSLSVNLASGGSPFVRSYTRTGTVSGFTSATTSAFVLGQPTVAGRDVCAIVCAPSAITGADLIAIERFAASIGATL